LTKARFLLGARVDLLDATEHYSGISRSLGADFVNEVVRNLGLLADFPEASPIVRGDVRKKVMRRFPYNLLYFIEKDAPVIVAIMQHRRRPDYWHSRIASQRNDIT